MCLHMFTFRIGIGISFEQACQDPHGTESQLEGKIVIHSKNIIVNIYNGSQKHLQESMSMAAIVLSRKCCIKQNNL